VQLKIKRLLDLLLCLLLSPVLVPLFLVIAVVIKLDGGPVFFNAGRVGKNQKVFKAMKFRSMIVDADKYLDDEGRPTKSRITWIGKWLRRFSVDELPQVINVLKGDMSFIGPRPILPGNLDEVPQEYHERFDVAPGISGLAQVSGRNTLPWIERYKLDVKYVRDYSIWMDVKILFRTFSVVVTGAGMVADRNPDQARAKQ